MKKTSLIIMLVLLVAAAVLWEYRAVMVARSNQPTPVAIAAHIPEKETVTIGTATVVTEVARTPAEREEGLSDRDSLGADDGMLFLFDAPDTYNFWMNRMHFPLDFVWLRNGTVVALTEDVPTPSVIPSAFNAGTPVDAVLEVNVGWIAAHAVMVGDPAHY